MRTSIRRIGSARGVVIPERLLLRAGLSGDISMSVENGAIVLRKPKVPVRAGWAEDSRAIAADFDDKLVWPEFANAGDDELRF